MRGKTNITIGKSSFGILLFVIGLTCTADPTFEFKEERAYQYLEEQCQFGPRYPGSSGHEVLKKYLLDFFSTYTNLISSQEFVWEDTSEGLELKLTNIIVSFYPDLKERILLCAHWDTRPWADKDPDPANRMKPILGANDGASGVAVLMELASIVSRNKPQYGVDIVLFDGEDYGSDEHPERWCLGSTYFSRNLGKYKASFGILLDLVGDRDLQFYQEGYSSRYAKEVVGLVWDKAQKLSIFEFKYEVKHFVVDDHLPLIQAGIPCINIIDFDYPYWHTVEDTPDKCSAESLGKVGKVLLSILYD